MEIFRMHPDTGERFEPYRNREGYYVLADPYMGAKKGNSENLVFVRDLGVAVSLIRNHGLHLFVRGRGIGGDMQQNPITPENLIINDESPKDEAK